MERAVIHPKYVPWPSPGAELEIGLRLSNVKSRSVLRITGGCAKMSSRDARGVLDLFGHSFPGFEGVLLIGGTRTVDPQDYSKVIFGIPEIGPHIRELNPQSVVLGVIPRLQNLTFDNTGLVQIVAQSTGDHDEPEHLTIVHPSQDLVVGITTKFSDGEIWDDEVHFCQYIAERLHRAGGRNPPVLIAYNGGETTRKEILGWSAPRKSRGWPVILVKGSGRVTDEFANDKSFLSERSNVLVCEKSVTSLRAALEALGVIGELPESP